MLAAVKGFYFSMIRLLEAGADFNAQTKACIVRGLMYEYADRCLWNDRCCSVSGRLIFVFLFFSMDTQH